MLLIRSYHDAPPRFTEDDGRILALFGGQAAAALFTAEAFEQQRRAAQRREALLRLTRQFAAEGNPDQLLTETPMMTEGLPPLSCDPLESAYR